MTWLWILLTAMLLVVLVAVVYWQMIIAEGTYLGPRAVAWTYDLVARRYDDIKKFSQFAESWFVAGPLIEGLGRLGQPLVLDVATGTGRLPSALFGGRFHGQVIGLDFSLGMLRQARTKLNPYGERVCLVWKDASHLPFSDESFDAVTCLESLEFFPRPLDVLDEMVRVLAPGGVLFVTNRIGREARLLPGRTIPRSAFEQALGDYPLRDVQVQPWQVNYDLAMARKAGQLSQEGHGNCDLSALIRCPGCGGELQSKSTDLCCPVCNRAFVIREGIVQLGS
jgi:ubiquinone/menaquinone biosynthesis C-methylase UbiE